VHLDHLTRCARAVVTQRRSCAMRDDCTHGAPERDQHEERRSNPRAVHEGHEPVGLLAGHRATLASHVTSEPPTRRGSIRQALRAGQALSASRVQVHTPCADVSPPSVGRAGQSLQPAFWLRYGSVALPGEVRRGSFPHREPSQGPGQRRRGRAVTNERARRVKACCRSERPQSHAQESPGRSTRRLCVR
jgi:hypothetical protein